MNAATLHDAKKMPWLLYDHFDRTDNIEMLNEFGEPMTDAELLEEAEWVLYLNTTDLAYNYSEEEIKEEGLRPHPMRLKALKRYINRLKEGKGGRND